MALRWYGAPQGYRVGGQAGAGLTGGGLINPGSGLGTDLDKSEGFFLRPTRFGWAGPMEILCVQSWAARRARDLPVDDMFLRWREFEGDHAQAMRKAEETHRVTRQLGSAMRAARQHGTGAVVMMTTEAPMDTPLVPERIRPGDLKNLLVVDRWEMSQTIWESDPWSPNYGRSTVYNVHPQLASAMRVHHSRLLRFDGMLAPSDSGYRWYDREWGVPDLVPIMLALLQDQAFVSAIAHLGQEASIPILKIPHFAKALRGGFHKNDPTAPSVEAIGEKLNRAKSSYRLWMMDASQEFAREAVTFSGLAQILDVFQRRVANAADVPLTRWQGQSPAGLNATGESDMRNYVIMVEEQRQKMLQPVIRVLDEVLARDAGIRTVIPEFEWKSLMELSDQDRMDLAFRRLETVLKALDGNMIDEDEGREIIKQDPLFADLVGGAPDVAHELLGGLPPELQPDLDDMPVAA